MRAISIVGARPQFVKLAPVSRALTEAGVEHSVIHTGQHYDASLSDTLFADLSIPFPDHNLGVGSGPHGAQTGAMLTGIEQILLREPAKVVLLYGDTNSTLAGALAASKLNRKVVHIEAGLRSFNREMPEEINRVATDHLSDLLLAPTATAEKHLHREGLGDRTINVGDVMTDLCLAISHKNLPRPSMPGLSANDDYLLATIHRPENTDHALRLREVLLALRTVPATVVLAVHPRLSTKARAHGLELGGDNVIEAAPFSYRGMISALQHSQGLITDSGGLQKEAFVLGVPCTTIRNETEWVETLEGGWNVLCPSLKNLPRLAIRTAKAYPTRTNPFGDGTSAERMVAEMRQRYA